MKKFIAAFVACVMTVCMCAVVSFADNSDYRYWLDVSGSGALRFDQGENVTLNLSLTKDGRAFSYCELNATIEFDFNVTDVSYTIPGKSAVSVTPVKADPDSATSSSNPEKITINYAPAVEDNGTEGETANGNVALSFKVADDAATGYKNISVTDISVYVYEPVQGGGDDTSSGEGDQSGIESDVTSEEDTSSEDTVTPVEIRTPGVVKTQVTISEKKANDVNGSGATLRVQIVDQDADSATLSELSVSGAFKLSPEFTPDKTSYDVVVDADTTTVTITAVPTSENATVTFSSNNATSVSSAGVVKLSDMDSQMVTITVRTSVRTASYFITFEKESTSSDASSESSEISDTSSDTSSVVPGGNTSTESDTSSDTTTDETSSDDIPAMGDDSGNGKDGIGVLPMILIIILSFVCGFVLCLILVKAGVIGGPNDPENDATIGPVDEDSFNKASAVAKTSGGYTATRVMPIPPSNAKTEQNKKFEINIEYDDMGNVAENAAVAGAAAAVVESEKLPEPKPEKEEKKKKQSFFFDDEEF